MTYSLVTTSRTKEPRGGQHAGMRPSIIRVEYRDAEDVLCAVEIRASCRPSQHTARNIAIMMIDLICDECDFPVPDPEKTVMK